MFLFKYQCCYKWKSFTIQEEELGWSARILLLPCRQMVHHSSWCGVGTHSSQIRPREHGPLQTGLAGCGQGQPAQVPLFTWKERTLLIHCDITAVTFVETAMLKKNKWPSVSVSSLFPLIKISTLVCELPPLVQIVAPWRSNRQHFPSFICGNKKMLLRRW